MKTQNAGAIIQARVSSRRLYGKMIQTIEGVSVLEHLVRRLEKVFDRGAIILATSTESTDAPLAHLATKMGIRLYRGSLDNVLDRFFCAAQHFSLETVVRITGDNPLIEPEYLKDLLQLFRETNPDYATAKDPDLFPRGTTAEVLTFSALEKAWREGRGPEDQEHVTWYIRRNPHLFTIAQLQPRPEWRGVKLRLALDEPQDLELLRRIFAKLYPQNPVFGLTEIFELYQHNPELFMINRDVVPTHTH